MKAWIGSCNVYTCLIYVVLPLSCWPIVPPYKTLKMGRHTLEVDHVTDIGSPVPYLDLKSGRHTHFF